MVYRVDKLEKDLDNRLRKLVETYQGPKLHFIIIGGGYALTRLPTIPGVSRILHGFEMPYSNEVIMDYACDMNVPAVSMERVDELYEIAVGDFRWHCEPANIIALTAATISSRWRRGFDHAWIRNGDFRLHHVLHKVSEEHYNKMTPEEIYIYRRHQDLLIAEKVASILETSCQT